MSGDFYPANPGNTQLQIYSDTNQQLMGEVVMPSFSTNLHDLHDPRPVRFLERCRY